MAYRIPVPDIEFNPPVYYCKRRTKPFSLDGNIFKPFWEDVPYTSLFVDIEGDKREKPFCETKAKMQWDDENFYFAAVLYGEEIWATLTERDCVIFQDNDFEIFIDPDSDTHGYFEFEMNALNTVWDLFLNKPYRDRGAHPLNGWDIKGLQTAVSIQGELNQINSENKYWSVEVVIPFEALIERSQKKTPPVCGDYYRVNFSRVHWHTDHIDGGYVKQKRPEENWVWAPTGVINIHYPELWGYVFFTDQEECYAVPEVEKIKWNLRRFYYAMHKFYDENGFYTDQITLLDSHVIGDGLPSIEVTSRSFVLSQIAPSGAEEVVLYDDGRVEVMTLESYEEKLRRLPDTLLQSLSDDERDCMKFLYRYMPLSDIADYTYEYILQFVKHSLKVREEVPWGQKIKPSNFMNYVVQYRINNENIEFYSQIFYQELKPIIQGMTMKEAAIAVNYWCFEKATYQATNARTAAPLTTIKNAFGRCGEESTFLVAALRSVGIPARQCYAPRWSHCDDNHAWVEVLTEDGWKYLGACEPEMDLNRGWFRLPASKAMLIHNRVLSNFVVDEIMTRQTSKMTEINVLHHYATTKTIKVRVYDEHKELVEGAKVRFEVVNYSEFYPVATLTTNKQGEVTFVTGLGDLMIYAHQGELAAYKKVDVNTVENIELVLSKETKKERVLQEWVFVPPKGGVEEERPLTAEQQKAHAERHENALAKRRAYEATFYTEDNWREKLQGFKGYEEDVAKLLIKARGNHRDIEAFLREEYFETDQSEEIQWKIKMLQALEQKDLSDSTVAVLKEHFIKAYPYRQDFDEDVYVSSVLSPRIWIEMITKYREAIYAYFTEEERHRFVQNPMEIYKWIESHIRKYNDQEYSNLNTSPVGLLTNKIGNAISHKILFVAIGRTLGIPSKINQADGKITYYDKEQWQIIDDKSHKVAKQTGKLKILSEKGEELKYYHQYTLGQWKDGHYETLDYEGYTEDCFELEVGAYRLVTSNRGLDEANHVRGYYFDILEGETQVQTVGLMEIQGEKANIPLLEKHQNKTQNKAIQCWLAPGEEPTEHLLNEILEHQQAYCEIAENVVLYISEENQKQDVTLKKVLKSIPAIQVVVEEAFDIETYYSGLSMVEKRLPLAVVTEKKHINYGFSGYQVGIGQQLIQGVLEK